MPLRRATYNTDNTLTELLGMEAPQMEDYAWYYQFDEAYDKYTAHLATLRTLVCSPECRGLWKPGQVLAEGKDYEVRNIGCINMAFPLPVKSEDDLWYKAIDLIMVAHDKGLSKEDAISVVKSQFIITKR